MTTARAILRTRSDSADRGVATCRKLPQELSDEIIAYLHGDKQTLRECSLVCKDWVPSASSLLFYRFSWPPCHHFNSFRSVPPRAGGLCRCHPSNAEMSSLVACAEVFSRSQRISTAVRELRLTSIRMDSPYVMSCPEVLSVDSLLRMVDLLPHLRILHLHSPKLILGIIPFDYRETSRILHHLTVSTSDREVDACALLALFTYFRRISTLICRGFVVPAKIMPPKSLPPRVEVHTLHVSLDPTIAWLCRHLNLASLHSITATGSFGDISPELDLLIQNAVNLDMLVWPLQVFQPAASSWPPLRSLTIEVPFWLHICHADTLALWDRLMTVLVHINTSQLQELCLWLCFEPTINSVFTPHWEDYIADFEWECLHDFAERSRSLTKLRLELTFATPSPVRFERCLSLLRDAAIQHLPPQARDLLEVRRR